MGKLIHTVAFFGYSQSVETDEEYIAAYDSAKLVAQSGRTVVNGGGPGVMYAASKGAKDGGGQVEVVYYEPKYVTHFEGKMDDNVNIVDHAREEANYLERTKGLLEVGDAYVIFNGGTGTVSEFAMAWALARLYFEKHKPLIFYGAFWRNILDAFWKNMKVREDAYKVFKYATTPQQVIDHIEEYERMYAKYSDMTPEECEGDECELFLIPHEHNREGESGVSTDEASATDGPPAQDPAPEAASEADSEVPPTPDDQPASEEKPGEPPVPQEADPQSDLLKKLHEASQ